MYFAREYEKRKKKQNKKQNIMRNNLIICSMFMLINSSVWKA